MDADRFDNLARTLTSRSRRRFLGSLSGLALGGALAPLLGLTDAEAKNRRKKKCRSCGPCKTCRKGKCTPKQDGKKCGAGQFCVKGQCKTTGQGTCATGEDFCQGDSTPCGTDCLCWTTTDNQTRCGQNISLTDCNTCNDDTDCAEQFSNTPGVFCVKDTGSHCTCGGFCVAPCCQGGQEDGVECGPGGKQCSGGKCQCPPGQENSGGVCAKEPNCIGGNQPCHNHFQCCSVACHPSGPCLPSPEGGRCRNTYYCAPGLTCIGFVCRS